MPNEPFSDLTDDEVRALTYSDKCSVCRHNFSDVSINLIGRMSTGKAVLACPRCHDKICVMYGHTIYFKPGSRSPFKDVLNRTGFRFDSDRGFVMKQQ